MIGGGSLKLLFISSGKRTLSDLNPSIITAFKQVEEENEDFQIRTFFTEQHPIRRLVRLVKRFQPDIILIFGNDQHPITEAFKDFRIPIGLWVVNDPYSIGNYEKKVIEYDFMITEESSCVPFYKEQKGVECIHFPLAVNPKNYYPMNLELKYDICFIGLAWPTRIPFFNRLIPSIMDKNFILIGKGWEKLDLYEEIKDKVISGTITPNEVAKYYNESKIVLNIHREHNDVNKNPFNLPAYTPNNRTFDIAAAKAFQLITFREELDHYFKIDKEIVSYHDVDELVYKINYFLGNDALREKIAEDSYKRAISEHTYYHRVKKLIEDLDLIKDVRRRIT